MKQRANDVQARSLRGLMPSSRTVIYGAAEEAAEKVEKADPSPTKVGSG